MRSKVSVRFSCLGLGLALGSVEDLSALRLIQVSDGDSTIALGILGEAPRRRLFDLRSQAVFLNQTGKPYEDRITIEHNGLLFRPGYAERAWVALLGQLRERKALWQDFRLSGLSDTAQLGAIDHAAVRCGFRRRLRDRSPYYWVDLEEVRQTDGGYLKCLSGNTRYQVRRASKLYAGSEALRVSEAASLGEAMQAFEALKRLHNQYWAGKGHPGAFSNEFTDCFHHRLIRLGLPLKQVQLLTLSVRDEPIGYLYNFAYRSRVMSYQSGFVYGDDAKRKPGLVCHAAAIDYNCRNGANVYDFLMGGGQYKRSLSTRNAEMGWIDIQRPLLRFKFEDLLRSMKARFVKRRTVRALSSGSIE